MFSGHTLRGSDAVISMYRCIHLDIANIMTPYYAVNPGSIVWLGLA